MKKTWVIIGVIFLIVIVLIFINKKPKVEELNTIQSKTEVSPQDTSLLGGSSVVGVSTNLTTSPQAVSFTVNGGSFYFKPNIIKVKQGDTVTITFKNDEGFHDFKIDEYNVATSQIKTGEQETISFVADKKGSFEYYCSVGTHRQMGMKGTLIVE